MTVPGWAAELGPELDGGLVRDIVRCAVAQPPVRLRAVLAERLGRNASTAAAEVVAELAGRVRSGGETQVERAAAALLREGARVLAVGHPGYPPALATAWPELGAPAWLFVQGAWAGSAPVPHRGGVWAGHTQVGPGGGAPAAGGAAARGGRAPAGDGPAVAVVGTRRPTADGLRTARELGAFLAAAGVCVVSGLARGIDQAAHRGALSAGGATVAVLGTGLGVDYPAGDGHLREAIADAGALVTEYAPGTPPRPSHFLWRNRIISGLSEAVVVVEGLTRSGALHTARLAAAQGREVFGVPGSLHAPASSGPLALVRDGARVLTCFDDVLELLDLPAAPIPPPPAATAAGADTALAGLVGALLGAQPVSADELAVAAGLPVAVVLAALGDLGARGLARHTPRGFVAARH